MILYNYADPCMQPEHAKSGFRGFIRVLGSTDVTEVPLGLRAQGAQAAAAVGLRRHAGAREQHQLRAARGGAGHPAGAVRGRAQLRLHHLWPLQGRARRLVRASGAQRFPPSWHGLPQTAVMRVAARRFWVHSKGGTFTAPSLRLPTWEAPASLAERGNELRQTMTVLSM